jgi:hypothetical protein
VSRRNTVVYRTLAHHLLRRIAMPVIAVDWSTVGCTPIIVGALAYVVTQTMGRAAARLGLHRLLQANTVRSRRVLSFFVLGLMVIRRPA